MASWIQFTYGEGGRYVTDVLPVNPEELTISQRDGSTSYDIVGVGETPVTGKTALRTFVITSMFPSSSSDPLMTTASTGRGKHPGDYTWWRNKFRSLHAAGTVVTVAGYNLLAVGAENFSIRATITAVDETYTGSDTSLGLSVEWREWRAIPVLSTGGSGSSSSNKKGSIKIGSTVVCSGTLYKDSAGKKKAGKKEKKAKRKIKSIKKGAKKPYQVKTLTGKTRGWLGKSEVKLA